MMSGIPHGRLNRLIALVAIAIVATMAAASHAGSSYFGLDFPDRVAGAERGQATDYEKSAPGWGYSVAYDRPGWQIDVYIYDRGFKTIFDGPGSKVLHGEMERSMGEILALQDRGYYSGVELLGVEVIHDSLDQARFLCADYGIVHKSVGEMDSFLCMTGWNGKFAKFRQTRRHGPGSGGEARRFLAAWFAILWP